MQNEFYSEYYASLMNTGIVAKMWSFIHRKMEKPFKGSTENRVLEIGAGNGEHLKAIAHKVNFYHATDIRIDLLTKSLGGRQDVVIEMQDVTKLSYDDSYFDRVIVTCVLVHLDDPLLALTEIKRVVKPGGYISLYLPCEPGILLRVVRRFSTHAKARQMGIEDITFLHFLEHKNYYIAIDHFVGKVFANSKVRSRYYPLPFLSWNFNLFKLYTIKKAFEPE
jgi:phosphatidylethanolamine/phosphatidyl-N-methylethanolamine N-methyltransferase